MNGKRKAPVVTFKFYTKRERLVISSTNAFGNTSVVGMTNEQALTLAEAIQTKLGKKVRSVQ